MMHPIPGITQRFMDLKKSPLYVIILSHLKNKTMKLMRVFPIESIALVVLMASCTKDQTFQNQGSSSAKSSIEKSAVLSPKSTPAVVPAKTPVVRVQTSVNLGVAGNFVILSKTGITDVYKSTITGNIGTSPITGAALLVSCAEVSGTIYTVDAAGPLPCRITSASMLTTAVADMQTAYTDAAGRNTPDYLNLGAGNIGGKTLTPGLYKWTSSVVIPTDVTISGGPNDVWIFQVAGTFNMSSDVNIILEGGAQAKNIFWQASGAVTLGTTSHFEGNILGQSGINLKTGASINGRMLAQTAVTLQMNTVNKP
jgi:hypothetical protein